MGKKHKRSETPGTQPERQAWSFDLRSIRVMRWGGGLVLMGFFCLTQTDVSGSNWASWFSPLLLVSGYFLIALGFFLPPSDPVPAA